MDLQIIAIENKTEVIKALTGESKDYLNSLKLLEQLHFEKKDSGPQAPLFFYHVLCDLRQKQVTSLSRLGMLSEGLALANETLKMLKDENVEMYEAFHN